MVTRASSLSPRTRMPSSSVTKTRFHLAPAVGPLPLVCAEKRGPHDPGPFCPPGPSSDLPFGPLFASLGPFPLESTQSWSSTLLPRAWGEWDTAYSRTPASPGLACRIGGQSCGNLSHVVLQMCLVGLFPPCTV